MTLNNAAINGVLDTDIGTDVDDLMALALILQAKEVNLRGITTVYGDSVLRNKIVHHVLKQANRLDIPVVSGNDNPLLALEKPWMAGHEGKNLPEDVQKVEVYQGDAPDFIIKKAKEFAGNIDLFAIGPLTNLAQAILRDREALAGYNTIYVMGGVFGFNDPDLVMPRVEHNIKCDPEAARVVFDANLPIKLISLDVTYRVPLGRDDIEKIGKLNNPFHQFLYKELNTWLEEFLKKDYTHMHDPLTIAAALWPEIFEYRARKVDVELGTGKYRGMTSSVGKGLTEIAIKVDTDAFHKRFMKYILRTEGGDV